MKAGMGCCMNEEILEHEQGRINALTNPDLLLNVINEIQKDGIIGEEDTLLSLINKINLRLVKNKTPTSDNVIVSDKTGAGKDYLVKRICMVLLPKNRYFHRTEISDKTFDYWKPLIRWEKNEEGKKYPVYDSWDGYVLHLEDPREEALNGQSFKVMASGGTESTKIIDHHAVEIKIEGKPTIIVTSLKTLIEIEGMRRWDTLRIDTTEQQTIMINKYKLTKASGNSITEQDKTLRDALQNNLFPKNVIIPYAEKLFDFLPNSLLARTQTDKLLDYIKSSAVLHQYQREKIDNDVIIANGFDLAFGWFIFTHLNSSQGLPTNIDEEELVRVLLRENKPLSIKELSNLYTRHTKQWIYNNKEKLVEKGLIKIGTEYDDDSQKDIERITIGDNSFLVLKSFNEVLKYADKEGFNGFNGFKEILCSVNTNRKKLSLKPIFETVFAQEQDKTNKTFKTNHIDGTLKPFENHIKTSTPNHMNKLKEYCKDLKIKGKNNSYENLCFNFDPSFINQCIASGLLIKSQNGSYDFLEV